MNKKEVQSRVLKDGKLLPLNEFEWDEKTRTFSSAEKGLVLDFAGVDDCTFKTDSGCTFKAGSWCTFKAGSWCTFKAGRGCVFNTGGACTFKTSFHCTFDTGWYCTFNTDSCCTFKTGSECMFETGNRCVIVRRDVFEVIRPVAGTKVQLCPLGVAGHLVDGKLDGVPHIIADGILSRVVSKKGGVYKVVNHGEEEESWLIQDGENFAHGATLAEARESLIYKAKDRDTSAYEKMTLDTVFTLPEVVKMYRTITGACAGGVKSFVEARSVKERYSVREILAETRGHYGHEVLEKFVRR